MRYKLPRLFKLSHKALMSYRLTQTTLILEVLRFNSVCIYLGDFID